MPLQIPLTPADITPHWLTAALRAAKTIPASSQILTADLTRIGEDEGFTGGRVFRIRLTSDAAPHAPASLVAKLSPANPDLRATMAVANGREVAFYADLAQMPDHAAPQCHHAAFDPATGASVILLKDLSSHRSLPFAKGCGRADARRVVEQLADLHAKWWNSPALAGLSAAPTLTDLPFATLWARYRAAQSALLPDLNLPPAFAALGTSMAKDATAILGPSPDQGPLTLLHRDVQTDNILFAPQTSEGVILLDWQLSGKGRGAYDLGYFLISSLDPLPRRNSERGLVAHYHARLLQRGVKGYGLADCWADYLQSMVGKLFTTVAATVLFDNSGPHKTAWRRADLTRLFAFCADHHAALQPLFALSQK